MSERGFHLFAYGTLRKNGPAAELLRGASFVRPAAVQGTLYDIEGRYPALLLYGENPVHGEIWRCPPELLAELDEFESVEEGLFRRVGVEVDGLACWTYVAGPALARQLTPSRRVATGIWQERNRAG